MSFTKYLRISKSGPADKNSSRGKALINLLHLLLPRFENVIVIIVGDNVSALVALHGQ